MIQEDIVSKRTVSRLVTFPGAAKAAAFVLFFSVATLTSAVAQFFVIGGNVYLEIATILATAMMGGFSIQLQISTEKGPQWLKRTNWKIIWCISAISFLLCGGTLVQNYILIRGIPPHSFFGMWLIPGLGMSFALLAMLTCAISILHSGMGYLPI